MTDPRALQFGDFTLDMSQRILLRNGQPVSLAPKALDVLAALAAQPGRVVTKDELLKDVWPDAFVEESNLAYQVFAIRKALGETADGQKYIETMPKRGYRFVASLTKIDAPDVSNGQALPADCAPVGSNPSVSARAVPAGAQRRHPVVALWAGLVVLLVATAATVWVSRPTESRQITHVELLPGVTLPEAGAFAISPDGRSLVFAGQGDDGVMGLWLRALDSEFARPIPGTEVGQGGPFPPMFWSPDSRFVAFDRLGELKKVAVGGGAPQTVCTLPILAVGGSWSEDDVIIVGSPQTGLYRCPAQGGKASAVTQLDSSRRESAHLMPRFLPDGRHFLYLSVSRDAPENTGIYVRALDAPAGSSPVRLLSAGFGATYVPGPTRQKGHLLFARDGALFAQDFDTTQLRLSGDAVRVSQSVGFFLDGAFFSASNNGTLVVRRPDAPLRLTWVDRRGNVLSRVGEPGRYVGLALAPGNTRAVVAHRVARTTVDQDLWLVDLPSGRSSRLTFDAVLEDSPVWSADGTRVAFTLGGAVGDLFEQATAGEEGKQLLVDHLHHKIPTSYSQDGRFLLYSNANIGSTRMDVWVLPLTGARQPFPLIRRAFDQHSAQFSPDGRWVAYVSNESGREEVLVRPFDARDGEDDADAESVVVSTAGGTAPRWRADGKELFFLTADSGIAAATVSGQPTLTVGAPITLFRLPGIGTSWSPAADGARFLVLAPERAAPPAFSLTFNWQGVLSGRQ